MSMALTTLFESWGRNKDTVAEAGRSKNLRVLRSMLGPAFRGLILRRGSAGTSARVRTSHQAFFDWTYTRNHPRLASLYSAAKRSQWNAETDLDWRITVDPHDRSRELLMDDMLILRAIPAYRTLPAREQEKQRHAILVWLLSQFLHGEQGALFAACQVTEAIEHLDGKLYGSTQVVDEGRHVEVFHRYLTEKLEKRYEINDNLYTIMDALMTDARWDMKFLGMQILVEGLALAAFCTLRVSTKEPLLRELLKYVITDEARHVHYGVVALGRYYQEELSERERREREDWAYEMSLLMRNRFLAHEFFDEYYGHMMKRREWDQLVLQAEFMKTFRSSLFKRIIPNLKGLGLLTDRVRPHYQALGLLEWESEKPAPELSAEDLLAG